MKQDITLKQKQGTRSMKQNIGIILVFILLLTFGKTFAQVRINLNNLASVTFPSAPVKSKTGANSYVYSAKRNDAFYIVTVTDMPKRTDLSENTDSLKRFYEDLIGSTIKKASAKLLFKEEVTVNGAKGIEFSYTDDNKAGFPDTRTQRSVYLNKTLLSFAFWTFKAKLEANTADKEIFFNTISKPAESAPPASFSAAKVTAEDKAVTADTAIKSKYSAQTRETLSKVGYSTGYILGAIILTALIIGFWWLIIKKNKKVS